jgi:hypothetical protein
MNAVPPDHIVWNWESQVFRVGTDRLVVGPTVLMLPALSSIFSRREMRLLQERACPEFRHRGNRLARLRGRATTGNPMAT